MSQQIYDTKQFPFSNVDLGKPYNLNGMHFIKMFVKDSPIYVQPPKCFIKQGILKSGKKWFCDLVFSIDDGYFLTWLEQIEEIAKQKIFENRANWFETELDEHDIENSLVSPYKMFRSGKLFIIRANLPTTLDKCNLKIYDESENEIQPEDVKDETNVITILELKGIKCSARNFQFVFDVRQMLVVSPVKIFEKCIIKKTGPERGISVHGNTEDGVLPTNTNKLSFDGNLSLDNPRTPMQQETSYSGVLSIANPTNPVSVSANIVRTPELRSSVGVRGITEEDLSSKVITKPPNENTHTHLYPDVSIDNNPTERVESSLHKENKPASFSTVDGSISKVNVRTPELRSRVGVRGITEEDLSSKVIEPTPEMYEFEIDLADLEKNDTVQIKPRNDVYYKLYKEAKQKAKEAKLLALSNYLEAKRLKTTYLLEDSSDSSDDDEDNMDEDAI